MQRYIDHTNLQIYSGDRHTVRDPVLQSDAPEPRDLYTPTIVDGLHTGWELISDWQARAAERISQIANDRLQQPVSAMSVPLRPDERTSALLHSRRRRAAKSGGPVTVPGEGGRKAMDAAEIDTTIDTLDSYIDAVIERSNALHSRVESGDESVVSELQTIADGSWDPADGWPDPEHDGG